MKHTKQQTIKQYAGELNHIVPNNMDSEQAVLGLALLQTDTVLSKLLPRLTPDSFYFAHHQVIFREIVALQETKEHWSYADLIEFLRTKHILDDIGGEAYITHLIAMAPVGNVLDHHVAIVEEKHTLRKLMQLGAILINPDGNAADTIKKVQQQLSRFVPTGSVLQDPKSFRKGRVIGYTLLEATHRIMLEKEVQKLLNREPDLERNPFIYEPHGPLVCVPSSDECPRVYVQAVVAHEIVPAE